MFLLVTRTTIRVYTGTLCTIGIRSPTPPSRYRITPQTLHPKTLNPKTLNPKTLNPKTLNPKTLNPKTLNPKPLKPQNPKTLQALVWAFRPRFNHPAEAEALGAGPHEELLFVKAVVAVPEGTVEG